MSLYIFYIARSTITGLMLAIAIYVWYLAIFSNDAVLQVVSELTRWSPTSLMALIALITGFPLVVWKIPNRVDRRLLGYMARIDENVCNRIRTAFIVDPEIGPRVDELTPAIVIPAFFRVVDNDQSLQTTVGRARATGLLLWGLLDAYAIALGMLYVTSLSGVIAVSLGHDNKLIGIYGAVMIIILLLSQRLAPLAFTEHRAVSNEQIDSILFHDRDALRERLSATLNHHMD